MECYSRSKLVDLISQSKVKYILIYKNMAYDVSGLITSMCIISKIYKLSLILPDPLKIDTTHKFLVDHINILIKLDIKSIDDLILKTQTELYMPHPYDSVKHIPIKLIGTLKSIKDYDKFINGLGFT